MKMIEIRDKDGVYNIDQEEFVSVSRGYYALEFGVSFKTRNRAIFTYETHQEASDAYARLLLDLKGDSE